jgi:predicted Zn-dependent protease
LKEAFISTRQILDIVKKSFPDSRVYVDQTFNEDLNVRFACNKIVQNMIQEKGKVTISVLTQDQKVVERKFNQFRELNEIEEASILLRLDLNRATKLDYGPSIVNYSKVWGVGNFNRKLEIQEAISKVGKILKETQGKLDNTAGIFSNRKTRCEKMNSDGLNLTFEHFFNGLNLSGFKGLSEITYIQNVKEVNDIELDKGIEKILKLSELPLKNHEIGNYRVLLSPSAVSEILAYAFWMDHFSAKSVQEGTSVLKDFYNKQWIDSQISLQDNPDEKRVLYLPFDELGYEKKPQTLIEDGKIKNWIYNERQAQIDGKRCYCANNLGLRNQMAFPQNIELLGGSNNSDIFMDYEDGLYVNEVHYLSISDPNKMRIFGLTRGGFIKIHNGVPVAQYNNMRFEVSIPELLQSVKMLGSSEEFNFYDFMYVKTPALMTENFSFTQTATTM